MLDTTHSPLCPTLWGVRQASLDAVSAAVDDILSELDGAGEARGDVRMGIVAYDGAIHFYDARVRAARQCAAA